jgi:hypothetical protein
MLALASDWASEVLAGNTPMSHEPRRLRYRLRIHRLQRRCPLLVATRTPAENEIRYGQSQAARENDRRF